MREEAPKLQHSPLISDIPMGPEWSNPNLDSFSFVQHKINDNEVSCASSIFTSPPYYDYDFVMEKEKVHCKALFGNSNGFHSHETII